MKTNIEKFFIKSLSFAMAMVALCLMNDDANAAARLAVRNTPSTRKTISTTTRKANTVATQPKVEEPVSEPEPTPEPTPTVVEPVIEPEPTVIENKTAQFNEVLSDAGTSSRDASVNNMAELIKKQRAAFEANENAAYTQQKQQEALATGKNACDTGLRKCMSETCGANFTKCALDGDTIFGDKLNKCRRETTCTGEEFRLFTTEIKADRDFNVQMASYTSVIECGNSYNSCIQTECGATFNKCLGKNAADRAIKKCATIAKNCTEQDSGLSSRMGVVIGKLREVAEKDVKADEKRLYELRDLMRKQCEHLGAMFDERSFDCVYTINFFAGENQSSPTASRKAYAGSSFVCTQEWFGINATTFKENAYRETRSQTAASSAMLGSGLGTAAGLITSGAIDRALDTQKAKKDYKKECKSQGGKLKDGECVLPDQDGYDDITEEDKDNSKAQAKAECAEQAKKDPNCEWNSWRGKCDCDPSAKEKACTQDIGTWEPSTKTCKNGTDELVWKGGKWINKTKQRQEEKDACTTLGANITTWDDSTGCTCLPQEGKQYKWNSSKKKCIEKVIANTFNQIGNGVTNTINYIKECKKLPNCRWNVIKGQCDCTIPVEDE